jgi:hypothetical protein
MAIEPDSSTAMDADDDNTITDTTADVAADLGVADAVDVGNSTELDNSNNSNEDNNADSSSENTQPQLLLPVEHYSPQQSQQQQQYLQPLELPVPPAPHTVVNSSDSVPPIQVQFDVDAQQQQQQQQQQPAPLLNLNLNKQYFVHGSNQNTVFGPQLPPHAVTVGTTSDAAADVGSVNSSVASDSMPGLVSAHDPLPLPLPAVNGGSSRGNSSSNVVAPTVGLIFPPPEFAKVKFSSCTACFIEDSLKIEPVLC